MSAVGTELCSDAGVGGPCSVTSQSVILGKLLTPSADLENNPFFRRSECSF